LKFWQIFHHLGLKPSKEEKPIKRACKQSKIGDLNDQIKSLNCPANFQSMISWKIGYENISLISLLTIKITTRVKIHVAKVEKP
jgi:hypothetical protein